MEKIKLFKKRNFGEIIGTTFDLMRQNIMIISICFIVFALPFFLLSTFVLIRGYQLGANVMLLVYNTYLLALFADAVVLHEVIIAYEFSPDTEFSVSDVWPLLRKDLNKIIKSFFGFIMVMIISMSLLSIAYFLILFILISVAQSYAIPFWLTSGLSLFIPVATFFYFLICFSNFLMLRLRSKLDVVTSLSQSISLTFHNWRWWRTLGVNVVLMIIVCCFCFFCLIPFSVVATLYHRHFMAENMRSQDHQLIMIYLSPLFAYFWNLVLLGNTINYYSLIEDKEHIGLYSDIQNLGLHPEPSDLRAPEY